MKILRAASLPANTKPAEVIARLGKAGLGEALAKDMVEWLGPDINLYLPKKETPRKAPGA